MAQGEEIRRVEFRLHGFHGQLRIERCANGFTVNTPVRRQTCHGRVSVVKDLGDRAVVQKGGEEGTNEQRI